MLKDQSLQMLQQWSPDILEIWTEVYALVVSKLVKTGKDFAKTTEECRKTVSRMADRNQAIKVRIKVPGLIGFLAKYDSIGS